MLRLILNKIGNSAKFSFELEGRSILKNRCGMRLLMRRQALEHGHYCECWDYRKKVCSVELNDQEVEVSGNAERPLA